MSRAKPLAVSWRRLRSISRAFITTRSSSPRNSFDCRAGSMLRFAAMFGPIGGFRGSGRHPNNFEQARRIPTKHLNQFQCRLRRLAWPCSHL